MEQTMSSSEIILFLVNQTLLSCSYLYFKKLASKRDQSFNYLIYLSYLALFPFTFIVFLFPSFSFLQELQFSYLAESVYVIAEYSEFEAVGIIANTIIIASLLLIVYKLQKLYIEFKKQFTKISYHTDIDIYTSPLFNLAFSFKLIKPRIIIPQSYIDELTNTEIEMIIAHEIIHLKRNDFYVNIIQKLIKYAFFYNPIVRKIDREIDLLREVIVDSEVIHKNNVDKNLYMNLLINVSKKTQLNFSPDLIVPFSDNHTIIKRRIIMLNENLSARKSKSNYITLSLSLLLILFIFSCSKEMTDSKARTSQSASKNSEIRYFDVEVKPEIIERGNVVYPTEAKKQGIEGTVTVSLTIDKDGLPENIEVIEGNEVFHESTINAIKQYRFKPAVHKGKKVKVKWAIPIRYRLKKEAFFRPVILGPLKSVENEC
jgi:bla regulator protein blaR1